MIYETATTSNNAAVPICQEFFSSSQTIILPTDPPNEITGYCSKQKQYKLIAQAYRWLHIGDSSKQTKPFF